MVSLQTKTSSFAHQAGKATDYRIIKKQVAQGQRSLT